MWTHLITALQPWWRTLHLLALLVGLGLVVAGLVKAASKGRSQQGGLHGSLLLFFAGIFLLNISGLMDAVAFSAFGKASTHSLIAYGAVRNYAGSVGRLLRGNPRSAAALALRVGLKGSGSCNRTHSWWGVRGKYCNGAIHSRGNCWRWVPKRNYQDVLILDFAGCFRVWYSITYTLQPSGRRSPIDRLELNRRLFR